MAYYVSSCVGTGAAHCGKDCPSGAPNRRTPCARTSSLCVRVCVCVLTMCVHACACVYVCACVCARVNVCERVLVPYAAATTSNSSSWSNLHKQIPVSVVFIAPSTPTHPHTLTYTHTRTRTHTPTHIHTRTHTHIHAHARRYQCLLSRSLLE